MLPEKKVVSQDSLGNWTNLASGEGGITMGQQGVGTGVRNIQGGNKKKEFFSSNLKPHGLSIRIDSQIVGGGAIAKRKTPEGK